MRVNAAGRINANHSGQKGVVGGDQPLWNASRPQNFLTMVYVVNECVDRPHALFNSAGEATPFRSGDDPRNDVERDQPLGGFGLSIYVERYAGAAKKPFAIGCFLLQQGLVYRIEPAAVFLVWRRRSRGGSRSAPLSQHFIETACADRHCRLSCCAATFA